MTLQTRKGKAAGIATLVTSAVSNQIGAATGSLAFPAVGPVGVVAIRQLIAAAVLLPTVRPRFWKLTRDQWWPVILLAVVFGTMNLGLYTAVERIGLGLAVTLEFLGPLAVAVCTRRSRRSVACGLLATAGVIAIAQPEASSDYLGIGSALLAAASWAAYILLNRTVGTRVPGIEGTAVAAGLSAVAFAPIGFLIILEARPSAAMLLYAVIAGVLSSVVPYAADLIALRRVPAGLFGILMSINPVFAAVLGTLALGQWLNPTEALGISLIVIANLAALAPQRPRLAAPPTPSQTVAPACIPAKNAASSAVAVKGRTLATYWSGRTTTTTPPLSSPRSSKMSAAGSTPKTFSK